MLSRLRYKYLNFWSMMTIFLLVFFTIALVYPLGTLIINSVTTADGSITFDNYLKFFQKKYYYQALQHSLLIGVITTAVSIIIGTALAYVTHRFNVILKGPLKILMILSLMSPPFIGAYSWILLCGRSGVLTNLFSRFGITLPTIYGKTGIILVFSLSLSCYVFRYVTAALKGIDRSLEEAAESLGASPLRRLFTISIPVIMPSITSVMVIVFMQALSDFGTPILIGEGYKTMPVLVYNAYLSEMGGDARMAGAISVITVAISLGILLLQKYYISKKNYKMSGLRPPIEVKLHGFKRVLVSLPGLIWVGISLLPLITVIVTSFIKCNGPIFVGGFTFENYKEAFAHCGRSIFNSFFFSTVALVFIVIFGITTSYVSVRRKKQGGTLLDTLVMFPYVIPGSIIGICYIVAFNKPPFMICGTIFVILLSYTIRRLPNTVRSSVGILESIDPSLDEASISLGVPALKTFFKITARLMLSGIAAGAVLSWISCMNELSSSLMLYTSGSMTMPIAVYTYVSRGNYGIAAALGTIMTAAISAALILVSRMTRKTGGII